MVGTILPIGYGERLRGRWPSAVVGFGAGAVVGGLITGFVVALLGRVLFIWVDGQSRPILAAIVAGTTAIVYGLSDASLLKPPRYRTRRQVPSWWYKRYNAAYSSFLYGGGLSIGVLTHLPIASFFALALWCLSYGSPLIGAVTWACFGVGRFLTIPLLGLKKGSSGDVLEEELDGLAVWEGLAVFVVGVVAVGVGAHLLTFSALRLM